MKALRISPDLALPVNVVTATIVAYGGKGMGKTNLGAVLVEEMARCGLRWAWLDPLGVSWGLRHSADGTGPGVECLILGGPKGDVPIEADGGAAAADVVIEEPYNVLLDFSRKPSGEMWSIGEKIRFVTAYAHRLFQRQGELLNGRRREPLFQVLDEAARYIPQVIPSGAPDIAQCVGAWEQLVEEGRNIGLGVGLMTQRSARMNKSVSELADVMFAFRTVGPNSLGAVMDWLGEHVAKDRAKVLATEVRALDRGRALVVSPGWLKFEGVVGIRLRETFDSSATPKPGERARTARGAGARPDLDKIRERMAAQIEKAKADDPKELRRQLAEMRAAYQPLAADLAPGCGQKEVLAALHRLKAAKPAPAATSQKTREVPVLKDSQVKRLEAAIQKHEAAAEAAYDRERATTAATLDAVRAIAAEIKAALAAAQVGGAHATAQVTERAGRLPGSGIRPATSVHHVPGPHPVPRAASSGNGRVNLGPGRDRILAALSLHGRPLARAELGVFSVLSSTGGTFKTYLPQLIREGLVAEEGNRLQLTTAGAAALQAQPDTITPGSNEALHAAWLDQVGNGGMNRLLSHLMATYPTWITRAELGDAIDMAATGGTFKTYFPKLVRLGLVESNRDGVRATDHLFGFAE